MILPAIAVGKELTNFLSDHYEVIKNEKDEEGFLLDSTNDSFDAYDYPVLNYGEDMFSKMRLGKVHSYNEDEDEHEDENTTRVQTVLDKIYAEHEKAYKPYYCIGNNETTKNFIQNCVICFENRSVYAFRLCRH